MVTYALLRQMSRVASTSFQKKDPHVSVDAGVGEGAKGGTEKVRSFVTFSSGWPSLSR